jgi:hypothetical protein
LYNIYDPSIDYSSAASQLIKEQNQQPKASLFTPNESSIGFNYGITDDSEGGLMNDDSDEW